jgi:hypothetical protein
VALNSHVLAEEERESGLLGLLPKGDPLVLLDQELKRMVEEDDAAQRQARRLNIACWNAGTSVLSMSAKTPLNALPE